MYTIDDGGGYREPEHVSHAQVKAQWTKVLGLLSTDWQNDTTEANAAMEKAKKDGMCAYVDDFKAKRDQLWTRRQKAIDDMEALIGDGGPFAANDGVDKSLRAKSKEWSGVASDISKVISSVYDHLLVDEWKSSGAQNYKAALPTQVKALDELQGLSQSQGSAVDQVGLMNAWMFVQARDGLQKISTTIGLESSHPIVGENINNQWYYDYDYFHRTLTGVALLEAYVKWGQTQQTAGTADWGSSAKSLSSDLSKAEAMPNNLRPSGVWPDGKAQVTGEAASTYNVTYGGTYVGGTNSQVDGGGIDLNRFGRG